jgi:putative tryptophan/tyrosine transport system substrate-binding protein
MTLVNEQRQRQPMKRKLVCLLTVLLYAYVPLAEAQQPKTYLVGILSLASPNVPEITGLRDGLKEAGYVEGKNLILEITAKKTYDELRPISQLYVERRFDVIVGIGNSAPLIAKESTQEIPIVFVGGADPIQAGLVKSMARPHGNITGVARNTDLEIYGKRLEVFKETVPTLRRIAVLYNARGENPTHAASLTLLKNVAPKLGLQLAEKPIKVVSDVERTLSSVSRDNTDGLFLICATIFRELNQNIAAVAMQKKLALFDCSAQAVSEFGALLHYGTDAYRLGHRGAWYVDRLLKGAKLKTYQLKPQVISR